MTTSLAFPASRVARGTAIETLYEQLQLTEPKGRPVSIFVICLAAASKSVASVPYEFVSLADTASVFGYTSTAYQVAKMLKPSDDIGVGSIPITFFPLAVTTGSQAAGTITPVGTCTTAQTYVIRQSNKPSLNIDMAITETVADFVTKAIAAVNGVIDSPCAASDGTGKVTMTPGVETTAAAEEYFFEVDSPADADLTFTIVQPTGGGGTVDYSTAWAVFNDEWYSHVINAVSDATDSTYLDSAEAFGALRWGSTIYKPFKSYTGTSEAVLATITTITDARVNDETNSIKHSPASNDTSWNIAARMVAMQALSAEADPASDYCLTDCSKLTPGAAASQLDSDARQGAVLDGLSTIEITSKGTVVSISDSIMCYHPPGEDPPAFRYDRDIEVECAMIYNLNQIFNNPADSGNPLVPDKQATTNPNTRKPSYFKNKVFKLFDGAALNAWISDPDYAKKHTTVKISSSNPKRIDAVVVYLVSGTGNVFSVTNKFSYFVG